MSERFNQFIKPMLTDFYQISMCYAYWCNGRHMDSATFDAYFRKCPFKGEYAVFAGSEDVLQFLENLRFSDSDIEFIQTLIPHGDPGFFDWLRTVDGSQLKVYAVADGTVVFPNENVIRVEGPLAVAQLCETTMLVLSNFATLITTNAARFRKGAGNNVRLLEFGLRRAQGPDGGMTASKYSYLGGFDSTSNTLAAKVHQIPCSGTHAHAYVSSFSGESDLKTALLDGENLLELAKGFRAENSFTTNLGELVAFVSYALAFPNSFLALVDTYDTLASGIPNFLCVALSLHKLGYTPVGIRLDSGDLAYISSEARQMFIATSEKYNVPFQALSIVASNDINEPVIHALNAQAHEINVLGIGTNLVTCQGQPALGMVFKLVEINNTPRIKLSEDKAKVTIPGKKTLYRLYGENSEAICDVLTSATQAAPEAGSKLLVKHAYDERQRMLVTPSKVECLHRLIWDGSRSIDAASIEDGREHLKVQLTSIRPDITRSLNPTPYKVSVSAEIYDLLHDAWERELPVKEVK